MKPPRIRFSGVRGRTRHRMLYATAAAACAFFGATATVGTALADPAQQSTTTFTGTFDVVGPVTCGNGPLYDQTQNVTITDHEVATSGQTFLDVITLKVSFTAVPFDPALPTATGTIEGQGTFNFSVVGAAGENFNTTTTATYSDGSTVTAKETDHFTIDRNGNTVTNFERCASPSG